MDLAGSTKRRKRSKKRRRIAQGLEMAGLNVRERMQLKMEKKARRKMEAKYSVQQLLKKAVENLDNLNFELAQMFCQRALDMEPNNLTTLDMMGNIFAELGNSEKAKETKFMYLGQIHCGHEAVQYFKKGIELLIKDYQRQKEMASEAASFDPDNAEVTAQNISTAFCSLAEIFLTDLCSEEDAATKCQEALGNALAYDPENPEALQLMASYLFSTEQQQEGKTYLMKGLKQWLPSFQSVGSEVPHDSNDLDPLQNLFPPYESRITAAKLLIEVEEYEVPYFLANWKDIGNEIWTYAVCQQYTSLLEIMDQVGYNTELRNLTATEVLEGLLDEDDEVVQLSGCLILGSTPIQAQRKYWKFKIKAKILEILRRLGYSVEGKEVYDSDQVIELEAHCLVSVGLGLQAEKPSEDVSFKDSARTYLTKTKKLYMKLKCEDSSLLDHTEQLLEELRPDEDLDLSDTEKLPIENIEDDFVETCEDE